MMIGSAASANSSVLPDSRGIDRPRPTTSRKRMTLERCWLRRPPAITLSKGSSPGRRQDGARIAVQMESLAWMYSSLPASSWTPIHSSKAAPTPSGTGTAAAGPQRPSALPAARWRLRCRQKWPCAVAWAAGCRCQCDHHCVVAREQDIDPDDLQKGDPQGAVGKVHGSPWVPGCGTSEIYLATGVAVHCLAYVRESTNRAVLSGLFETVGWWSRSEALGSIWIGDNIPGFPWGFRLLNNRG